MTRVVYEVKHSGLDTLPETITCPSDNIIEQPYTVYLNRTTQNIYRSPYLSQFMYDKFKEGWITITPNPDEVGAGGDVNGPIFGNTVVQKVIDADYTITAADCGTMLVVNDVALVTITLPEQATEVLPQGFNVVISCLGAGGVAIATEGTDTLAFAKPNLAQGDAGTIVLHTAGAPNLYGNYGAFAA